jgi:hypothetical protein
MAVLAGRDGQGAQQLRGKVQRAEEIISYRIQELAVDKGNEEERPSAL